MTMLRVIFAILLIASGSYLTATDKTADPPNTKERSSLHAALSGLKFRGIGPAGRSGRVVDIVKNPIDKSIWYVAAASGNVWKTVNNGTTWAPIFDRYGSYSIGCLALDPGNPDVVWVGAGENNSQRSVGYGDGVYKSTDGGASFKNMGLKNSEHIGKILIDPRDANTVYVAAQGPLWAPGGDRGLYKTTDGGATWLKILDISENTGVSDIALDPKRPDTLYAASYQRRRHVGVLIAGGPESAIYKSEDGGARWRKLETGLPTGEIGRIGLAVSPINPAVVYAQIAAAEDQSGFFRSENRGETWRKMSDYICVDPQYYMELFPDPHRFDRVYAMDVIMGVTDNGGRSFEEVGSRHMHVDNHALVFDPDDPDYLMLGNDGGVYESWDRGETWKFIANLPITQFYRVAVDNDQPFYNVYGGTQDNATLGGPSRTNHHHGIRNQDWINVLGGDGFQARVDPTDPNIVYAQYQYAGIVRYDKRSGERIDIQPQPDPDDPPLKWNWDSPLLISPHLHTRLYFGANRLFRSDDRGNAWVAVSGDLTRGLDRNRIPVMGRIWSPEAVWKNVFTSPYGSLVSLDESPLKEGLIYAGTDDGLIHVTEDGGQNWRRIDSFPGVAEHAYVADILASRHSPDVVFAVFNNHKRGDFKPYILKSADRGRRWTSIAGNLPDRHVVWCLEQDHVKPDLLFAGAEFGLFATIDGGAEWTPLSGDLPVTQFRDLAIQQRENDLVAATFGRGFFILDDYSPLREITPSLLAEEAYLFPVKDPWMYIEASPLGGPKGSRGDSFYTAPNPPFGAVFTYYLKDELQTQKQRRKKEEKALLAANKNMEFPTWQRLRLEDREESPAILLTIRDADDQVVRSLSGPTVAGIHRLAWDLRYPSVHPDWPGGSGPLAAPGLYSVTLAKREGGQYTELSAARPFQAKPLGLSTATAAETSELHAFRRKTNRLLRAALGAERVIEDALAQLLRMKRLLDETPGALPSLRDRAVSLNERFLDLQTELEGDRTVSQRREATLPSILDRIQRVVRAQWSSTTPATTTHRRNYEIAAQSFKNVLDRLRILVDRDLRALQDDFEEIGAPWSPGRGVPRWAPE